METRRFQRIAKALAEPRRFEILERIARSDGELSCVALRKKVPLAPATLSHHLKELAAAGLVDCRKHSKFVHLKLRRSVWREYLRHLRSLGA
jgi:ArsR family transcriptional regulator, arsenate/arsenite/antimonite-responsive transcriptional repressor